MVWKIDKWVGVIVNVVFMFVVVFVVDKKLVVKGVFIFGFFIWVVLFCNMVCGFDFYIYVIDLVRWLDWIVFDVGLY